MEFNRTLKMIHDECLISNKFYSSKNYFDMEFKITLKELCMINASFRPKCNKNLKKIIINELVIEN